MVALETAVLSLGLPYPTNIEVFEAMEQAVRSGGATPAAIAIDQGAVRIGLPASLVKRMAKATGVVKTARRDIGRVLAEGATGATTVSSTLCLSHLAGIPVAATGGIGGVHIDGSEDQNGDPIEDGVGSMDVSADIPTLADIPGLLVSSGVKSICDAVATGELLETLSVPVVGLRTDRFPHFYAGPSPLPIPRVESASQAARVFQFHRRTSSRSALLVANPVPSKYRLNPKLLAEVTKRGMTEAARQGIRGQGLTPFLLAFLARETDGLTVRANRELLVGNALLAGRIAVILSRGESVSTSRSIPV